MSSIQGIQGIQGRTTPISPLSSLPALNSSYTPSRHGKAPLENRKASLEVELSRILQLPSSEPDREQRAMRVRRHIALLERHIALLDAANGERPEFTEVQGRPDRDRSHSEPESQEQPEFSVPEEPVNESSAPRKAPQGGDNYARAMLGSLESLGSLGSLYAPPAAPGTVQPWENRSEPAKAVKVGRNFDVSV